MNNSSNYRPQFTKDRNLRGWIDIDDSLTKLELRVMWEGVEKRGRRQTRASLYGASSWNTIAGPQGTLNIH